jgi:hypothetical protein
VTPVPVVPATTVKPYPNPVKDGKLSLAWKMPEAGQVVVRIRNLNRVLLIERSQAYGGGEVSMPLDVSGLPKGVYLYEVELKYPSRTEFIRGGRVVVRR